MKQIAETLGLDRSTVSLALSGSLKVAGATRRRVQEAARKVGYSPNLAARILKGRAPQLFSLVLPASFPTLASAAAAGAMSSLSAQASDSGVVLNVVTASSLLGAAEGRYGWPHMPDGLLVWGDVPLRTTQALCALGRPVVVLDPNHPSYRGYQGPTVGIDNRGGATAVVTRLLDGGANRLLFVQVVDGHLGHEDRWSAAREAWLSRMPAGPVNHCSLAELTDEQLGEFSQGGAAAVFCSNDVGALQVWHRAAEQGIAVPGALRVAGFDGEAQGRALGLTSVHFDGREVGRRAFSLLEGLVAGEVDTGCETVPAVLLDGRSA